MAKPKTSLERSRNRLNKEYNARERRPGTLEQDSFVINDIELRIPPTGITIQKRAFNKEWQTLRTAQGQKTKSGHSQCLINITTVFKMSKPSDQFDLIKLVSGLRATPFCVVRNDHLIQSLGYPDSTGPVSLGTSKARKFQPIMLAMNSMTISTMGKQGMPDCLTLSINFIWFNYLPYTPVVAFKTGGDLGTPGVAEESSIWKKFYEPFIRNANEVQWPHEDNDLDSRTTTFTWREFLMIPHGNEAVLQASGSLVNVLKNKPDKALLALRRTIFAASGKAVNPDIAENLYLSWYKQLVKENVITGQDLKGGGKALNAVLKNLLDPLIKKINTRGGIVATDKQDLDASAAVLAARLKKMRDINTTQNTKGFQELQKMTAKYQGNTAGGLSLHGRKRQYKIINQNVQDTPSGPPAVIETMVLSFENQLASIPMVGYKYPTLQHIGSVDARLTIMINARHTNSIGESGTASINEMYDSVETQALRFRQVPQGLMNVQIKNDFLSMFGLNEWITEGLSDETINEMPSRSMVSLTFIQPGVTSDTKLVEPEEIKQEFVPGSLGLFKTVFKTVEKYLEREKGSRGERSTDFGYYRFKTVRTRRDTKNLAFARTIDDTRDAYNEFAKQVHNVILREEAGVPGFSGPRTYGKATYLQALFSLQPASPYGWIPGLEELKKGILERIPTLKSHPKFKTKAKSDVQLKKEIKALKKLAKASPNALEKKGLEVKLEGLVSQRRNQIQTLQKMGLFDYIRKTTKIATEVIRHKSELPQFSHIQKEISKTGIGKGLSAYQDFRRQLSSVAAWLEKTETVSDNNLLKYDPDCYFWYPAYDSGGTPTSGLIDPYYISEAKRHSLESFRNAQASVDAFFKEDYLKAMNNSENPHPFKQMEALGVSSITEPFYAGSEMQNSLRGENGGNGIPKDVVPDATSKMPTNWYGDSPPNMTAPSLYTASTNMETLWDGTDAGYAGPPAPKTQTKTGGDYGDPGTAQTKSPPATDLQFIWPIKPAPGPISRGRGFYGRRRGGTVQHRGIDVPKPNGTPKSKWGPGDGIYGMPVYAVADGHVTFMTQQPRRRKNGKPLDYAGTWVQINHSGGWRTRYMHLKPGSITVRRKDRVKQGQMIGRIGRTDNRTTWTHLHFDMKHRGKYVDPVTTIKAPMTKGRRRSFGTGARKTKTLTPAAQRSVSNNLTFGKSSTLGKAIKAFEKSLMNGQAQRMVRAYPAFKLYFIEDDSGERKRLAFDDFFSYHSVQSIRVVQSCDIAADLCEIFMTNVSGLLSNRRFKQRSEKEAKSPHTSKGKVTTETRAPGHVGTVHENPIASLLLQEGMKIHLRLGYSSDPDNLGRVFTGKIVSVQFAETDDLVRIVAQSHATELVQDIKGLEKPGVKKSYGIWGWNYLGFKDNATTGRILENMMAEPEVLHFGRWTHSGGGQNKDRDLLTQRWTFVPQPQDDNIFAPSPQHDLNTLGNGLFFQNLHYTIYRTTIWDIFQEMTLRHPNFIARPTLYTDDNGERMTMFFGLPNQLYFARSPVGKEKLAQEYLKDVQKEVVKKTSHNLAKTLKNDKGSVLGQGLNLADKALSYITGVPGLATHALGETINSTSWYSPGGTAGIVANRAINNAASTYFKKKRLDAATEAGWVAPFRKYHLVTSAQHIVANNIEANSKDVANTVVVKYGGKKQVKKIELGGVDTGLVDTSVSTAEESFTLKLDASLPTDEIRTQFGQFVNVNNEDLAKRYALGMLLRNVKNIYKGNLIILGNPDINPYDIVYLVDEYTDMIGAFEVREVQHSFNHNVGYVTEIKPAMFAQASEWSLLHSAVALGIVMEGAMKSVFKGSGAGKSFSPLPYTLGAGVKLFGGFLAQKIINFTQLGHPIVMSPLMYHGRPFSGGVPTRKIQKSMWDTTFGKWSPSSKVGFDNWLSDGADKIVGLARKYTGQDTVGDFWRRGAN